MPSKHYLCSLIPPGLGRSSPFSSQVVPEGISCSWMGRIVISLHFLLPQLMRTPDCERNVVLGYLGYPRLSGNLFWNSTSLWYIGPQKQKLIPKCSPTQVTARKGFINQLRTGEVLLWTYSRDFPAWTLLVSEENGCILLLRKRVSQGKLGFSPVWIFAASCSHKSINLKPTNCTWHSSVQLFYFKCIMSFIQLHVALIINSQETDSSLYSSLNICIPVMELCPFSL